MIRNIRSMGVFGPTIVGSSRWLERRSRDDIRDEGEREEIGIYLDNKTAFAAIIVQLGWSHGLLFWSKNQCKVIPLCSHSTLSLTKFYHDHP